MLTGKTAIVTGAARGLGLAVSRQLAEAGARVVLVGRDAAQLARASDSLRADGLPAEGFAADVSDPGAVAALAGHLRERHGRADILVNNAGVFLEPRDFAHPAGASLLEVPPEVVARTFETNTLAPLRLMQAIVPLMQARNWGRVVNVSSGMGRLQDMGGYWPGYRSSKTALNALTRILAAELQGSGIKVNAVCPGWCRTEMGGPGAERSVEQGAASIVWAALLPDDGPSGGFFRDGQPLGW